MTNFRYELIKLWDEYVDDLKRTQELGGGNYDDNDLTFKSFMNWVFKTS